MNSYLKALDDKGRKRALAIGKTAAKLFNSKGYLETSMDDIAGAAKMSKGGVYHYFSSKDQILYFILSGYMDLILGNLEEDLSEIKSSAEKIQFIITRHIELYTKNSAEAKTLLHDATCLPKKYFNNIASKERAYYEIVAGSLKGLFDGPVKKSQLTTLTFLLFGMCNWIYSWYDPKGPVTPEELSHMIYNIFIGGIDRSL
jgi:AcrR family transcriptional regulator